jgi:hypothetical protein
MSGTTIEVMIAAGTFIITTLSSVLISAFISGMHWGELRGDVRSINERLAKIEGMFTLRIRHEDNAD